MSAVFYVTYFAPLFAACARAAAGTCTGGSFAAGAAPLLVAFPAYMLHGFVADDRREHVGRHAVFAASFLVGAASLDWQLVAHSVPDPWAVQLVVFFGVAFAMLSLFTVAHVLELRGWGVRTHYGDVAGLPLLLISIATFYNDVPRRAFLLSRAALVAVPVLVAWTTMLLIAFVSFTEHATSRVRDERFPRAAAAALVLSSVHLLLIEQRAQPLYYFAFAAAAPPYMQLMLPFDEHERVRRCSLARVAATLALACAACVPTLLFADTDAMLRLVAVAAPSFALGQETGLVTHGSRWGAPTMLLALVPTVGLLRDTGASWGEAAYLAGAYAVGAVALPLAMRWARWYRRPLPPLPSAPDTYDPPQLKRASVWDRIQTFDAPLPPLPLRRFTSDGAWLHDLGLRGAPIGSGSGSGVDDGPGSMSGIWWMKDNTMGMQLLVLHPVEGDADARTTERPHATVNTHYDTTRDATLLGLLKHGLSFLVRNDVYMRSRHWIQTSSFVDLLGLTREKGTLWIYTCPGKADEMMRLQFGTDGDVTYQYRLLRIARRRGAGIERTVHYSRFMRVHGGRPCLFASSSR